MRTASSSSSCTRTATTRPIVKAREALEQGRFGKLVHGQRSAAVDARPGVLRLGGVARDLAA